MDVKWLPGWEEDVRIKSVNIVDEASNLQHIFPFFETETSEVLLWQYRQWTRAYGRPRWLKVDASRTNLGETLQRALEADGTKLLDVPEEAHEQVGRVEVHGRYFEDMLARVLARIRPNSRAEWLECIYQTMEAKNSLTRRCGYSPFQIAIGRDPELLRDLLQDLPNVINWSSILHDDVAAHTARIRSNARLAAMQLNDILATRRALDQRPRPLREFSVGDEVAVWRRGTGKGAPGKQRRAQWRGPGIILGAVRGNYLVAMPGSVIKAAPEQLRHRTAEEQETDRVVLRDLRRTADVLRESGSAKNFEDITEQDWPDGDLNSTAGDMETNQETSESQLPSRWLARKTPSEIGEKHSGSQIEHVEQTPVDAPSQSTVQLETAPFSPVLEPVSKPTQLSEIAEPRAKQPRIGERVYPSPLPMPIPSTPLSQNIAETAQQVDDCVQDPEDEKEEMMLVTAVAPGPHSEGCLLARARREICPSSPECTPTGRELIAKGAKVETDMLIHD